MPATILLALQLIVAPPVPEMLPEAPAVIDLLAPVRLLRCPELKPDEIVVCGQRPGEEARIFFRRDPWGRPPRREGDGNRRGGIRVPF